MSLFRLIEAVSGEAGEEQKQKDAIKKVFSSGVDVVGSYSLDKGAVVMTLFYHSQYGVGSIMTYPEDGSSYSCFVPRDRFPDRGLTGSDWESRLNMQTCLRQSQLRVKRLIRYGRFVKARLEQVQRGTGEIRRGVKQEKG